MRLALVTHNVIPGDGQGRVNFEFVRHALSCGHDVELFSDTAADELVSLGARWTRIRPGFEEIDLLKVWRFERLANKVLAKRGREFDAVIGCGVVLSVPHDLNVAHFVHGSWIKSEFHSSRVQTGPRAAYQWLFSTANARWEKQTFASARKVGAVSDMVARELQSIGVAPDKVVVLGNGVDVDEFKPGPSDRSSLGLPEGVPLALFVGDIQSSIKNLDSILSAMNHVPELHLAVAGRPERSPYPALAQTLGVAQRVHFLGFRSDIADLMRAADFFVLTSRRDSSPLVVLEALASGLPVVTARTVGNHNLVEEGCGFVVSGPDSSEEIVDGLTRLVNDSELRAEMSAAARRRGLENTWSATADRYLRTLEGLVGSGERVGSVSR